MDIQALLRHCDHTLLRQTATWEEIRAVCDDGIRYRCASVCIPASYVPQAADYAAGRVAVCTVIGFPNGYDTTAAKCFMAADAVRGGADEVDMVINLGWVKDGRWDDVLSEVRAVKESCAGKLLKVIVETCFLTEAEKIRLCEIVTASGADYIKTWPSLQSTSAPTSRSRPPAALPPWRTGRTSWPWGPTAWAPAASSSWSRSWRRKQASPSSEADLLKRWKAIPR